MRRSLKFALLAAVPLEATSFCFFSYPVDDGYAPDKGWLGIVAGYQWLCTHWPALMVLSTLEHHGWSAFSELLVFFISGYVCTVLLLLAMIPAYHWFRRRMLPRWFRHRTLPRTAT